MSGPEVPQHAAACVPVNCQPQQQLGGGMSHTGGVVWDLCGTICLIFGMCAVFLHW